MLLFISKHLTSPDSKSKPIGSRYPCLQQTQWQCSWCYLKQHQQCTWSSKSLLGRDEPSSRCCLLLKRTVPVISCIDCHNCAKQKPINLWQVELFHAPSSNHQYYWLILLWFVQIQVLSKDMSMVCSLTKQSDIHALKTLHVTMNSHVSGWSSLVNTVSIFRIVNVTCRCIGIQHFTFCC